MNDERGRQRQRDAEILKRWVAALTPEQAAEQSPQILKHTIHNLMDLHNDLREDLDDPRCVGEYRDLAVRVLRDLDRIFAEVAAVEAEESALRRIVEGQSGGEETP